LRLSGDEGDGRKTLLQQVLRGLVRARLAVHDNVVGGHAGQVAVEEHRWNIAFQQRLDFSFDAGGRGNDVAINVPLLKHGNKVFRFGRVVVGAAIQNAVAAGKGVLLNQPGHGGEKRVGNVLDDEADNVDDATQRQPKKVGEARHSLGGYRVAAASGALRNLLEATRFGAALGVVALQGRAGQNAFVAARFAAEAGDDAEHHFGVGKLLLHHPEPGFGQGKAVGVVGNNDLHTKQLLEVGAQGLAVEHGGIAVFHQPRFGDGGAGGAEAQPGGAVAGGIGHAL
nr:hypothetical protein [Tanacetum cinerariifolium]